MNLINSEVKTMSSREIASLTGKRHGDVMRDIRKMYDDLGESISALAYTDIQNKERRHYELDKEHTECLLTGYNAKARMMVIKRWNELESQQLPQIPQTYAAALLEAGRLAQIVDDQSEQLAIAAPKVEVYEMLADRKGDVSTTVIAKQLGMTAIKLNRLLRDNGIKWEKADLPKAGYSDWFNVISDVRNGHEFTQCLVTPLGQIEIAKLINDAK